MRTDHDPSEALVQISGLLCRYVVHPAPQGIEAIVPTSEALLLGHAQARPTANTSAMSRTLRTSPTPGSPASRLIAAKRDRLFD